MRYLIEIVSRNRFGDDPLSRAIVDSNDLAAARSKAIPLLEIWTKSGATHARVLGMDGQVAGEVQLERDDEPKRPEPDSPPTQPDIQPDPRPEKVPLDKDGPEKEPPPMRM